jgi:hypothetical protein
MFGGDEDPVADVDGDDLGPGVRIVAAVGVTGTAAFLK